MIKKLFGCVREYKKAAIITMVLMVLEVFIDAVIPFYTSNLVNAIDAGVEMNQLIHTGAILLVLALISLGCGSLGAVTASKSAAGFGKNLRHDIFTNVQTFSFENIDKFSSASLVTRMTTDVQNIQMSYMMLIRVAVRAPLNLIFSAVMAYIMGGKLALAFVVILPVMILMVAFLLKKVLPIFQRVFKKYDKMNESIEENVRAMRVVKGFARENYEKNKFAKTSDDICDDFTYAERMEALSNPIMQFCLYFNMIFILVMGSKLIIGSQGMAMGVGQISAMLVYGMQILMSLTMLAMILVMLTMSAESGKRIVEVLDEKSSIADKENPVREVADGSVDFENVSFKYSEKAEKYSLSDVNLHIDSGMTVGILGGTGSGKTSLIQLISRLYDATEGSVKVGGKDVRDYDLESLRNNVAVVLQKNLLFSGTIKDNLRWGNPDATDEELIAACKLSQADEFIESFPDGYDTYIEQGGTNVSGGQKQRICIARALLKKPKILILDDSTSAVDMKTDALIRQGFKSFIPQTTKIIIAQRVASVEDADLILIMDNGRIVDMGNHDQLMANSQIYKEIYDQQTNGGNGGEDNE